MALNLGELVAGLRADDAPFTRSLTRAELAMRGLTRDVNGQLRDMNGRFVRDGDAMGRSLSYSIGNGARQAVAALGKVAPAVAAIGVGLPAVAAVTAALGGLAAGAVAAGLAVKAFSLAAGPQMDAVQDVATLAEEAQKAAAAGAEDAAEKQKAYTDALKQLPPATQETAKAFIGLKKDYKGWSDEMSGTTMPVFTKGIEILRDLLPTLTPFVRAAASAIGDFLDGVAAGVKSAGFKEWAADMSSAAGPALRNFLAVIKNLAIGFGGLLQAFLPVSDGMTGGLLRMSQAFADWGSSLKDSAGFAQFMELAREGGKTLGQLALAAGNLLVALGPLIGVTTQVALALARIINALPPEVLSLLATTIAAVAISMKVYAAGTAVATAANRVLASSTWTAIAGWTRMMAVGLMVYARIAAAAVVSAARTAAAWIGSALTSIATWVAAVVRAAVTAVAQFALMAARAVAWAAVMAAQWLIAMGPIGWITIAVIALVALVIANWEKVKAFTVAVWGYIVGFLRGAAMGIIAGVMLLAKIPGLVLGYFTRMKDAAVRQASSLVSWMRGLPGRIRSALGNLGSLLVSKGRDVVRGLWNGIKSMGSWLKNQLIGFAKGMIPGPIAKALGISSPSKLMADQIGRWIPAGVAQGVTANAGVLDKAMASLVSTPTPSAAMAMGVGGMAAGTGGSAGGGRPRVVELRGGTPFSDFIIETLRDAVGDRGGDVQFVLGKRR